MYRNVDPRFRGDDGKRLPRRRFVPTAVGRLRERAFRRDVWRSSQSLCVSGGKEAPMSDTLADTATPGPPLPEAVQEVRGFFPSDAALQDAIGRLSMAGFDRADISLPAPV